MLCHACFAILQCLIVASFLVPKDVLLQHFSTLAVMLISLFPSSRLQLELWTSPQMEKTKWSFLPREEGQRRLVEVTICMSVCLSGCFATKLRGRLNFEMGFCHDPKDRP